MEYATLVIQAPHADRQAELMAESMNKYAAQGWRVIDVMPWAMGSSILTFERTCR